MGSTMQFVNKIKHFSFEIFNGLMNRTCRLRKSDPRSPGLGRLKCPSLKGFIGGTIVTTLALTAAVLYLLGADVTTGDQPAGDGYKHRFGAKSSKQLPLVENPVYKENCGACHFPYQPQLLPSASWRKIVTGLNDHFGESFELDAACCKALVSFLEANAAERSDTKLARKIVKCLKNTTPARITEIPYIRKEHHDISSATLQRSSIGSLSNCIACHQTALNGIYNEHSVVIPE